MSEHVLTCLNMSYHGLIYTKTETYSRMWKKVENEGQKSKFWRLKEKNIIPKTARIAVKK